MSYPLRVQSTAFRGQTFWVVVNDGGKYDGTGDGHLYLTREDAEQAMARTLYLRIHLTDDLPTRLSRAEYERRSTAAGAITLGDDDLSRAEYGLVYGSYGPGQSGADADGTREVSRRLGLARLYAIRAETPAPAPIVRPEPVTRPCALCGTPTSLGILMTSAHGRVCPDCYDME